jgi:hypothetical protein
MVPEMYNLDEPMDIGGKTFYPQYTMYNSYKCVTTFGLIKKECSPVFWSVEKDFL